MQNPGDKVFGLIGQSMGGPKGGNGKRMFSVVVEGVLAAAGSQTTYTVPLLGYAAYFDFYLIGAGGGPASGSPATAGGGGAEAVYDTNRSYSPGDVLVLAVGNGSMASANSVAGGRSTLTQNGVVIGLANGGGGAGNGSGAAAGAGGSGGFPNSRPGGAGAQTGTGASGTYGGLGGAGGSYGGGGGSGGFRDLFPALGTTEGKNVPLIGGKGGAVTNSNAMVNGPGGGITGTGASTGSLPGVGLIFFREA
ncbi:MAG TPA: hypothetical protein VJP88_04525 [Caulobacteraceae bacterium]|nr:hypothetical protein [Caulobacteraceae bacterium]